MGEVEEVAARDEGSEPMRELWQEGQRPGGPPGSQGREPVQLEVLEPQDAVRQLPHEQGPEVGRDIAWLWIPGQPAAASRPKLGKFGVYYGKKYAAWLPMARDFVKEFWPAPKLEGPAYVSLAFHVKRSNTHYGTGRNRAILNAYGLERPLPLSDIDNYAKGPLDALTGVAFDDDVQVAALMARKQWTKRRSADPDEDAPPGVMVRVSAAPFFGGG